MLVFRKRWDLRRSVFEDLRPLQRYNNREFIRINYHGKTKFVCQVLKKQPNCCLHCRCHHFGYSVPSAHNCTIRTCWVTLYLKILSFTLVTMNGAIYFMQKMHILIINAKRLIHKIRDSRFRPKLQKSQKCRSGLMLSEFHIKYFSVQLLKLNIRIVPSQIHTKVNYITGVCRWCSTLPTTSPNSIAWCRWRVNSWHPVLVRKDTSITPLRQFHYIQLVVCLPWFLEGSNRPRNRVGHTHTELI